LLESWTEHLRQHRRVTNADRVREEAVRRYLSGSPKVTHYVAAEPSNETERQHGDNPAVSPGPAT